jgi:hypothetical protein
MTIALSRWQHGFESRTGCSQTVAEEMTTSRRCGAVATTWQLAAGLAVVAEPRARPVCWLARGHR